MSEAKRHPRQSMPCEEFDAAFSRICQELSIRTQMELAELLEIRQSSISDARRRNSLPADWLLKLLKLKGLNPRWIETGEGHHYMVSADAEPEVIIKERGLEEFGTEELTTELKKRFAGFRVEISMKAGE